MAFVLKNSFINSYCFMENALIIFVRNAEKGKVKRRLAASIGDETALAVYKYLLQYTRDICLSCHYSLFVFYSDYLHMNDVFDDDKFSKHLQEGAELGERIMNAASTVFHLGFTKVCIIGSDCYELQTEHIDEAFTALADNDVVIGPSADGGYYILTYSPPKTGESLLYMKTQLLLLNTCI